MANWRGFLSHELKYGFYLQLTVAQVQHVTMLTGHGMHAALIAKAQAVLAPGLVSLYQHAVTQLIAMLLSVSFFSLA